MHSLAGKVAFSITWAQLESLRSLPKPVPDRGRPYAPEAALISKGLGMVLGGSTMIVPTASGRTLINALVGLVPPQGHSKRSNT
jgi:hypothetical protein